MASEIVHGESFSIQKRPMSCSTGLHQVDSLRQMGNEFTTLTDVEYENIQGNSMINSLGINANGVVSQNDVKEKREKFSYIKIYDHDIDVYKTQFVRLTSTVYQVLQHALKDIDERILDRDWTMNQVLGDNARNLDVYFYFKKCCNDQNVKSFQTLEKSLTNIMDSFNETDVARMSIINRDLIKAYVYRYKTAGIRGWKRRFVVMNNGDKYLNFYENDNLETKLYCIEIANILSVKNSAIESSMSFNNCGWQIVTKDTTFQLLALNKNQRDQFVELMEGLLESKSPWNDLELKRHQEYFLLPSLTATENESAKDVALKKLTRLFEKYNFDVKTLIDHDANNKKNPKKSIFKFKSSGSVSNSDKDLLEPSVPFGLCLEKCLENTLVSPKCNELNGLKVPVILEWLITIIIEKGLENEGIFRIPGSTTRILKVKKQINKGEYPDKESLNIHDVAGLFKLFIRELSEPLMTFRFHLPLRFIQSLRDSKDAIQSLKFIVILLPLTNRSALQYIVWFLRKVSDLSQLNKMDASNLATVIGPNIVRSEKAESGSMTSQQIEDLQIGISCMKLLIDNYDEIFTLTPEFMSQVIKETGKS
ncbi:RhoGAP-domain-containing protein [Rozella allomycis CSF55]|uniref:Rho GTPase-activating protein domain-containing protein n=1 Tax=Rozella allomycis (strain CSF55) TaxID=988480 RepID=A0A075B265_ROZAC|nr:Rho GTPase-activating protein domain-containing protein [Rozella allomycis CSF55]RKP19814.1 RhoGAP-domain-containing protein [Rozella allomycis CSF55]|eukprot:EPZ36660.1 Rho GTPase-activating protein domain-containing protein [Rozella allomycis CSF55]